MSRIQVRGGFVLPLLVGGAVLCGCGKDSDQPKYRELTGRITAIDLDSGVVSMSYYNPKHKREMTLSGQLDRDAEIWINGVTAGKKDLRVGDRVTVTGREEKHNGERRLVATRVDVTRPEAPPMESTSAPAE